MYYNPAPWRQRGLVLPGADVRRAWKNGFAVLVRKEKPRQDRVRVRLTNHQLYFVDKGHIEAKISGNWVALPAQSMTLFVQGSVQELRQKRDCDGPCIVFQFLFRAKLNGNEGFHRPLLLPGPWWRRVLEIESSCKYTAAGYRVAPVKKVLTLIEDCLKSEAFLQNHSGELKHRMDTEARWMELWMRSEDIIRQRAASGLSIRELAEAVACSEAQLLKVYKMIKGISPKAALAAWRIEQAQLLLRRKRLSAKEVARALGYGSAAYFGTAFKHHTGTTPEAYAMDA